ncbi:hypothetical protein FXV91_15395 [Methanosarcina sp. DH2]|uniref:hypothetical protein n=1 Tax=Methanosarcina sp. DH2 TaxID=2605639 RepID=UPI001E48E531|nr:hypothetical protein [Methanosarcina sp. DH2]MCC4771497.1 hypothetical protein [Methanosarcina sp. DH2]
MVCESLNTCLFYNDKMPIESALGRIHKKKYCEGDKNLCARYKVASSIGKENVPIDLFPIMMEEANQIIQKYKGKITKKF